MGPRRVSLVAAVALCVATSVGCGTARDSDEPSPKVTVEMRADGYHPRHVEVPVGGRVTWINVSTEGNTAQSPGVPEVVLDLRVLDRQNKFDTHSLQMGEAHSWAFDTPGIYRYGSSLDDSFAGVVEVVGER